MAKPTSVVYCYGAWQDKFKTVKREGIQFYEGVQGIGQLKEWFPKGEFFVLFVLDDLMAEGGNDKDVLDTGFWIYIPPVLTKFELINYIQCSCQLIQYC